MECVQAGGLKLVRTVEFEDMVFSRPLLSLVDTQKAECEVDVEQEQGRAALSELGGQLETWEGGLTKVELVTQRVRFESAQERERLDERLRSLGYVE
jgi:hypothetical protein